MKTSGNVKDSAPSVARLAISATPPSLLDTSLSLNQLDSAVSPSPLIATVRGSLQGYNKVTAQIFG